MLNRSRFNMLGDEYKAQQEQQAGRKKDIGTRLADYEVAVRANRQLATALRGQGVNEDADKFAYRAHLCSLHLLRLKLPRLPQFRWLTAKPSDSSWLSILLLPLLFTLYFLFSNALGMEVSPRFSSLEGSLLLLGTIYFLVSLLVLVVIYQPLVRRLFAFLLLAFCIGFPIFKGFSFLLDLLLSFPAWQLLLLSLFSLALMMLSIWQKKIREWTHLEDYGRYLFSGVLFLLAGYEYKPARTFFWYIVVITCFLLAYHVLSPEVTTTFIHGKAHKAPLDWLGATILSITAFHGRGFFLSGELGYDDPVTILAALEAIIGLFIELSFIATFTGRFFRR